MARSGNGNGNGHSETRDEGGSRRVGLDGRRGLASPEDPGHSGRALVVSIVVGVLVLWGGLNLAFRQWRASYAERAAFGVAHVARAIEPLASVVPSHEAEAETKTKTKADAGARSIGPDEWSRAVADTRAMLVTLTAANLLDREGMEVLGRSIAARVASARPETARAILAEIWDEAEAHAGPVIDRRHPRPALLPPRVEKMKRPARRGR